MATITLYAGKGNQMSGLLDNAKKSVNEYVHELGSLKRNLLMVDSSICNVEDVMDSVNASTKTKEEKAESLEALRTEVEGFLADVVAIDQSVAEAINRSKEEFYDEHSYLKPDCEKSNWEKFKDGCKKFGEWCKERWREICETTGAAFVMTVAILLRIAPYVPVLAALVSGVYFLGCGLNMIGIVLRNKRLKTIAFGLRYPMIALQIGWYIPNSTNISTNAARFAEAFGFELAPEGSEVNAFRHALWISVITNRWGEGIALQVGNAHEDNQDILSGIEDIYAHKFKTLSEADEAVDLLNNVIGREVGKKAPANSSIKDMAKEILDHYHENGLNIVRKTEDGYYVIVKERLSEERYQKALTTMETLDENGFPSVTNVMTRRGDGSEKGNPNSNFNWSSVLLRYGMPFPQSIQTALKVNTG